MKRVNPFPYFDSLISSRGLTLIEVLAVTVVMGILLSATASMTTFLMRTNSSSTLMVEESQLMGRIAQNIASKDACTKNFQGVFSQIKGANPTSVLRPSDDRLINYSGTSVLLKKNESVPGVNGLKIKDVYVTGLSKSTDELYTGELKVEFDRGVQFVGRSEGVRSIPFYFHSPTTGSVYCTLGGETLTSETVKNLIEEKTLQICEQMGGKFESGSCTIQPDWAKICSAMNTTVNSNATGCVTPAPDWSSICTGMNTTVNRAGTGCVPPQAPAGPGSLVPFSDGTFVRTGRPQRLDDSPRCSDGSKGAWLSDFYCDIRVGCTARVPYICVKQ